MAFDPFRQAIYYLARFATSKAKLRIYLTRKANEKMGDLPPSWSKDLEQLITKLEKLGYVNDEQYGHARLRRHLEQGYAHKVIMQKLKQDGLDDDLIERLFHGERDDEQPQDDEMIARQFVKAKRLGPYRVHKDEADDKLEKLYRRDLAALARRGFSYDIARRVLGEEVE